MKLIELILGFIITITLINTPIIILPTIIIITIVVIIEMQYEQSNITSETEDTNDSDNTNIHI